MTPHELADIHAACFSVPRPWSTEEFEGFLASDRTITCFQKDGFALGQQAGPEAELLTIAVRPSAQCQGRGTQLLTEFVQKCRQRHVEDLFLEVAETNAVAISLYRTAGFVDAGLRKDYYRGANGQKSACLLMRRKLTDFQSIGNATESRI